MVVRAAIIGLALVLGLAAAGFTEPISSLEQEFQSRYQAILEAVKEGDVASSQLEKASSIRVSLQHELVDHNAEQQRLRRLAHQATAVELESILDQLVAVTAAREGSVARHLFMLRDIGEQPLDFERLSPLQPVEKAQRQLKIRFEPEDLSRTPME